MSEVPAKKLLVREGETPRTLVMSHAMLNELIRMTGRADITAVMALIEDLNARDLVLRRLFTHDLQRPIVDETELVSLWDLDLEPDTVDEIIAWVMGHFTSFFLRNLTVGQAVAAKYPAVAAATVATA